VPAGSGRGAVRVAVLGESRDAEDWIEALTRRAIEVIRVDGVSGIAAAGAGHLLAFATPRDASSLAASLAAQADLPPVTLLLSADGGDHPHTRLVKALVEAKAEWEGTFDAIVDPVALLDMQGTVVRANLGLARVVARSIVEIVDTDYKALLGAPEKGSPDPIAASLQDGLPRTEEARYSNLPGVQQVTTSPFTGAGGVRHGVVVLLKDMSEAKEQQERLLQASRLADIGQLAAGVAHEINTPLASIALRAESLLRSASDPRLQEIDSFKNFPRYLKTIDEEIFRCKKIISALLDFSRVRKPEVRETDLNSLAERAADLVGHQMKLKQISLTLALDPELPRIQADDGQLRQAIIALLMNALDATSGGGNVEVTTRQEGPEMVSLTVADDGPGIPPEHLGKIFSPFFSTKPVGQGTGLGLAICHGIITSHGGEIRVESEVGRGSRFALVLPGSGRPASS
jgi:two-component system, NtrC family, sensor kinase